MAASPPAYRFTVKDYHRMAEAEIFGPEDRVELLDGRVFDMAPIGSRHAACVKRLTHSFTARLGERAIVSVQDPIELDERSEPQPDIALLRPRADFYANAHPRPADVLLVVEVSEATAQHDLLTKLPLYLTAGVPEVWVVDVTAEVVHVATASGKHVVARGESFGPTAFPDVVLTMPAILG